MPRRRLAPWQAASRHAPSPIPSSALDTRHLNVPTACVFAQPCRRLSVPPAATAGQRLLRGLSRDPTRSLVNGFSCAYGCRLICHRALSRSPLGSVSCALSRKPPGGVLCTPPRRRPARCLVRIFYMRPRAASRAPQEASRVLRHLERGDTRAPGRHLMRGVSRTAVSFARRPTQASYERCLVWSWQVSSTAIVLRKASVPQTASCASPGGN